MVCAGVWYVGGCVCAGVRWCALVCAWVRVRVRWGVLVCGMLVCALMCVGVWYVGVLVCVDAQVCVLVCWRALVV